MTSPSQAKMSGLKAPTKISGLKAPTSIHKPSSAIAKPLSAATSTLNVNTATIEWKVGEACYVNGTKPGTIAFIGETQFKEGIWAGVILETNDGKNNGSLNGVTYFQTEENRGIFCKPSKLTREPETIDLNQSIATEATAASADKPKERDYGLKMGDKVIISSATGPTKVGILRFIGDTDFAKGEWAGVELEEKLGKNDGSVAGKRYFTCQAMYGVFAPAGKVQHYVEKTSLATPVRNTRLSSLQASATRGNGSSSNLARRTPTNLNKQHSGSNESLNSSIYSTASGIKQRVGINTKISGQTPNLTSIAAKKQSENKPILQVSELKPLNIG